MATRDRFGGFGEPAANTPLQRYICELGLCVSMWCLEEKLIVCVNVVNACDPQNFEPNLALNLEISDLINAKKGSAYVISRPMSVVSANNQY
jgi:ADP-ribosylation factor-binding protein GGA